MDVELEVETWELVARCMGRCAVDPQHTLYDQLVASAAAERILLRLQAYRKGAAEDAKPPWEF